MSGAIDIPIVSKFDATGLKKAQGALGGFGKAVMGIGAVVAGAFAVRAVVNFASETIRMAEEVKQSEAVLRQVAKVTGNFGSELDSVTSRLIKFANAQELRIGVDAEVIKQVQAQLLSFKALGQSAGEAGGMFDRATKAAFDMAMVLKKDAGAQAIALGKALENPIKGVTALARGGTTFTDQQKEQIRTLVESNRLLDAQALILTEVESQYGGAAEAGALYSERFRLAVDQIKETIGIALIPSFEAFVNWFIANVVPTLTVFFETELPRLIDAASAKMAELQPLFSTIGDIFREAFDIAEEDTLLQGFLDKIVALGENESFITFLEQVVQGFVELLPSLIQLIPELIKLAEVLIPVMIQLLPFLVFLLQQVANVFDYFRQRAEENNGTMKDTLQLFLDQMVMFKPLITLWSDFVKIIQNATRAFIDLFNASKKTEGLVTPRTGTQLPPARVRAAGGRVTGGSPYLVGEVGPELFVPGRGGNIVPNNELGMGGGPTYNITVNAGMGTNGAQVGEQIVNAIKRYERVSGPVFVSA